jgi:C4-dicarboxylate-specific signal transduction histidine kinase
MRSYSHNSSGEKSITPVGEIIEQVLDLCAERFRSSGIDLKVSLPSQPTFTLCDGTQAFQILLNLLNNSFDAIKQTKDPWVDMTVRKNFDSGMIDFVITDSGLGIDPLLQDKIFYPFFSTKEKKYGTGIGLSLSQNLAEKNNGSLRIDKNSKNTRFILSLPSVS